MLLVLQEGHRVRGRHPRRVAAGFRECTCHRQYPDGLIVGRAYNFIPTNMPRSGSGTRMSSR